MRSVLPQITMTRPTQRIAPEVLGPRLTAKLRQLGVPANEVTQVLPFALTVFEPGRIAMEPLDTALERAATTAIDLVTGDPNGTAVVGGVRTAARPFLAAAGRLALRYGPQLARWAAAAYATDWAIDTLFPDEVGSRAPVDPNAPQPNVDPLPDDPFDSAPPSGPVGPVPGGVPGTAGYPPAGYPGTYDPTAMPSPDMTANAGAQIAQVLFQLVPLAGALYQDNNPDVRDAVRLLVAATLGGGRQPQEMDRCGYLANAFAKRDPEVTLAIAQFQCGITYPLDLTPRGKQAWVIMEMLCSGLDFNDINSSCGC